MYSSLPSTFSLRPVQEWADPAPMMLQECLESLWSLSKEHFPVACPRSNKTFLSFVTKVKPFLHSRFSIYLASSYKQRVGSLVLQKLSSGMSCWLAFYIGNRSQWKGSGTTWWICFLLLARILLSMRRLYSVQRELPVILRLCLCSLNIHERGV